MQTKQDTLPELTFQIYNFPSSSLGKLQYFIKEVLFFKKTSFLCASARVSVKCATKEEKMKLLTTLDKINFPYVQDEDASLFANIRQPGESRKRFFLPSFSLIACPFSSYHDPIEIPQNSYLQQHDVSRCPFRHDYCWETLCERWEVGLVCDNCDNKHRASTVIKLEFEETKVPFCVPCVTNHHSFDCPREVIFKEIRNWLKECSGRTMLLSQLGARIKASSKYRSVLATSKYRDVLVSHFEDKLSNAIQYMDDIEIIDSDLPGSAKARLKIANKGRIIVTSPAINVPVPETEIVSGQQAVSLSPAPTKIEPSNDTKSESSHIPNTVDNPKDIPDDPFKKIIKEEFVPFFQNRVLPEYPVLEKDLQALLKVLRHSEADTSSLTPPFRMVVEGVAVVILREKLEDEKIRKMLCSKTAFMMLKEYGYAAHAPLKKAYKACNAYCHMSILRYKVAYPTEEKALLAAFKALKVAVELGNKSLESNQKSTGVLTTQSAHAKDANNNNINHNNNNKNYNNKNNNNNNNNNNSREGDSIKAANLTKPTGSSKPLICLNCGIVGHKRKECARCSVCSGFHKTQDCKSKSSRCGYCTHNNYPNPKSHSASTCFKLKKALK